MSNALQPDDSGGSPMDLVTVDTQGSDSQSSQSASAVKDDDQGSSHQLRRPLSPLTQFNTWTRSPSILMAWDEEEILTMIRQHEKTRKKWLHLRKEHSRCQPMLDQLTHTCQTLETQLKHARNQIHIELEKRKTAEREREALELQLANIRELLMRNDKREEEPGGLAKEERGLSSPDLQWPRCLDKDSLLSVLHKFTTTSSQFPLHTGKSGVQACRTPRHHTLHLVTIDNSNSTVYDDISFDKTEDDLEVKMTATKADYVTTKDTGESADPSANCFTFKLSKSQNSPNRKSKMHDRSSLSLSGKSEKELKRQAWNRKILSGLTVNNAIEGKKILKSDHIFVQGLSSHEAFVTSSPVVNDCETGLAAAFKTPTVPLEGKVQGYFTKDPALEGNIHQGSLGEAVLDTARPCSAHFSRKTSSNEPLATAAISSHCSISISSHCSNECTATIMDNEGVAASNRKDASGIPQMKNHQHLPNQQHQTTQHLLNQHLVQAEFHPTQDDVPGLLSDSTLNYDHNAPFSQTKVSLPEPPCTPAVDGLAPSAVEWLVAVGRQGVVDDHPLLSDSSSLLNLNQIKHPPIESHLAPMRDKSLQKQRSRKKRNHIFTRVRKKTKQMLAANRKSPHNQLRDLQLQFAPNLGLSKSYPIPTATVPPCRLAHSPSIATRTFCLF